MLSSAVPLTQFSVPAEQMLQICRERIDQQAMPTERDNLLAVSQVLAKLRYDEAALDSLLKWAVRCPDLEAFRGRLS